MSGNKGNGKSFDLIARDAVVEGKTFDDWAAEWWKWAMYAPSEGNPVYDDPTGAQANFDNDGPVFFVAGTGAGSGDVVRHFDVPADTPLFFPLLNTLNIAFPADPPDWIANELARDELRMQGMYARIDGHKIIDADDFFVSNGDFTLTAPEGSKLYDWLLPYVPDVDPLGENDAGSAGYWLMIDNLTPGKHTLKFGGWIDSDMDGMFDPDAGDAEVDVTAKIDVVDEVAVVEEVQAPAESLDLLV